MTTMTATHSRVRCFSHFIVVSSFSLIALNLSALEPYKRETSRGTQVYETAYYVSGTWHMECTENTSGRDQGYKSIQIKKTNGKVIPRTGFYETSDVQPLIELWCQPKASGHFTVHVGRNALTGTKVSLTVGGKLFEKVWDRSHESQCWTDDEETKSLLLSMLNSPELKYSYLDANKQKVQGVTQLVGLREIMKHGIDFLGFNPFAEK